MRKLPIHYGWIMVAAGFLVLGSAAGGLVNSYSLLVVPVCEDLGVSRSAMGLSQTLINTGGVLIPLLAARIYRHFRLRPLMIVAAVAAILAYFCLSLARSIAAICALVVLMSLTQALVTWMPFSILLNNWFEKKRGLAIGVAFMGSGVGGMIFNTLGGGLIASIGWRSTVQLFALINALIILPILIFVIRERPADMGLRPFGSTDEDEAYEASGPLSGASWAEEKRSAKLWLLTASILLVGFAINGLSVTMCAYVRDSGYSGQFAANVTAGYMGALAVGKILSGQLYDSLGARRATAICMATLLLSLVCTLLVRLPVMIVAMVLSAGLGIAFATVAFPNIVRYSYGQRDYNAFTGLLTAANAIGGGFAPTVFGLVCDWSGSYAPAYIGSMAITLVFGALLCWIIPAKPRYN